VEKSSLVDKEFVLLLLPSNPYPANDFKYFPSFNV